MKSAQARSNLERLNELLTLADRKEFIRQTGVGANEIVTYITGARAPTRPRITNIAKFFDLQPDHIMAGVLTDAEMSCAKLALARLRRDRGKASAHRRASDAAAA
jgi:hypothetical protein